MFWPGLNPSAPWTLVEAGPAWADRYGLRVLAVSPPGWETPPLPAERYRPRALGRLVCSQLDGLKLGRVAYVGASWGASIGCHLAATAPERLSGLVLLDAGYLDSQDLPASRNAVSKSSMRSSARTRSDSNPVLLLAASETVGEAYGHAALERFRDRLPSAAVEIIDSGHGLLADAPEETIGLVGRWVRASR